MERSDVFLWFGFGVVSRATKIEGKSGKIVKKEEEEDQLV